MTVASRMANNKSELCKKLSPSESQIIKQMNDSATELYAKRKYQQAVGRLTSQGRYGSKIQVSPPKINLKDFLKKNQDDIKK